MGRLWYLFQNIMWSVSFVFAYLQCILKCAELCQLSVYRHTFFFHSRALPPAIAIRKQSETSNTVLFENKLLKCIHLFQSSQLTLGIGCLLHECSGNVKSQLEAVIEHLVGRQGQARGAQVHAMYLSDWNRWSQDSPIPTPHWRAGNGDKGILLEIPAHLRHSRGKQIFFLCFCVHCCCIWACSYLLQRKTLPPCRCCTSHRIIALQYYTSNICFSVWAMSLCGGSVLLIPCHEMACAQLFRCFCRLWKSCIAFYKLQFHVSSLFALEQEKDGLFFM